jgi:UDP-GlcNAc:undecaprenyl-phosphate GlcNAc-1-phosphate transferase
MILWTFLLACILSLVLTPLARVLAVRWHMVDRPDPRKIHRYSTPVLGGLAVFAAAAIPVLLLTGITRQGIAFVLGGAFFLTVGLIDDLRSVGAGKLLVEFGVAFLVVWGTGQVFHLPWPILGVALTVAWIVGVANATNCLDCADGVAAGTGLIAALAFLALAVLTHQGLGMVIAASLGGAALGFLPYNVHPARIFLGNAGSLMLGYLIAVLGVEVSSGTHSLAALAAPAVILAIPVYDIIRVHALRFLRGERAIGRLLTSTGKDHLPHRLMDRGLSSRRAALVVWVGSMTTGAAGVALATVHTVSGVVLIGLAVVLAIVLPEREGLSPRGHPLVQAPGWHAPDGP